ncbi:hypothetical protein CS369_09955 [Candidatus Symbiopectobacterium sp. 'North America']|nr:hypothetical protein [Candidatus Symbiopectobacterium sp. 'North America']
MFVPEVSLLDPEQLYFAVQRLRILIRYTVFHRIQDTDLDALQNPSKIGPKDRKDWFQSENERIKLETSLKHLMPV